MLGSCGSVAWWCRGWRWCCHSGLTSFCCSDGKGGLEVKFYNMLCTDSKEDARHSIAAIEQMIADLKARTPGLLRVFIVSDSAGHFRAAQVFSCWTRMEAWTGWTLAS